MSRPDLLAAPRRFLASRAPRERRLILLAALAVALALALSLADWAAAERQRLARALPRAEATLARMQTQADDLARLGRQTAADAPRPDVALEAARAAARARGLALDLQNTPEGIAVRGSAAPDPLLDWLASLAAETRLYPLRLDLQADSDAPQAPLKVDGQLVPGQDR